MKKARKVVRIVLLALIIFVIVVVVAVHLFADRAVKIGIETAGSKALSVGVSVEDVDLSILRGRIGLKNLVIDNPPNYKHERLLELRDARVEADITSLMTDTVNVRDIKLEGVNLVLEQRGVSSNNLQDIIKSIPAGEKEAEEPLGKKLHIDNLELSDVTVRVKLLPVPGKSDTVTLKLKPIKMTDLGSDNKLDVAALSSKILVAIAGGVAEQGVGILPDDIVKPLASELKRVGKWSEALLDEGGKVLKEGTDLGKELTEGLKGLFKSKEEKGEDVAQ